MYTVKLTYFRKSGKYYSEGEYKSSKEFLFDIWDEVSDFRLDGKLPGLIAGAKEYVILVNVPDHPYDHPRLII